MLKITEHSIQQSTADGFGERVFEVYLVSEIAGEKRNVWRFEKRHQAEWIVADMKAIRR